MSFVTSEELHHQSLNKWFKGLLRTSPDGLREFEPFGHFPSNSQLEGALQSVVLACFTEGREEGTFGLVSPHISPLRLRLFFEGAEAET